jgi:hypothetical protein
MAHDVFISHSTKDRRIADAVCAALEADRIRCWVAPRDVPPGAEWATSIVGAIRASRVMIIVFSRHSSDSDHVRRELTVAVDAGAVIVPLKIDDTPLGGVMQYYLSDTHWLDVMDPPTRAQIAKLTDTVRRILASQDGAADEGSAKDLEPGPPGRVKPLLVAATALAVLAGAAGVWLAVRSSVQADAPPPAQQSSAPAGGAAMEEPPVSTTGPVDWGDWLTPTFVTAGGDLWTRSGDGSYTAVDQRTETAYLWSKETVEGDVMVAFDVTSPDRSGSAIVIVYGDGTGWTRGSLFFVVGQEFYAIQKHDPFQDSTFLRTVAGPPDFSTKVYSVRIEVVGDRATLYVDDREVCSSTFTNEINRSGRIALVKWTDRPEIRYSNVRIRTGN